MKLEAKSLLAALDQQKIEYKLYEHEAFFIKLLLFIFFFII